MADLLASPYRFDSKVEVTITPSTYKVSLSTCTPVVKTNHCWIDRPFLSTGWLNPLPAQQGVPGWQRMSMMKYYVDEEEVTSPPAALEDSLWAYDGVVLPGGMIIVGRWWHPQQAAPNQDVS